MPWRPGRFAANPSITTDIPDKRLRQSPTLRPAGRGPTGFGRLGPAHDRRRVSASTTCSAHQRPPAPRLATNRIDAKPNNRMHRSSARANMPTKRGEKPPTAMTRGFHQGKSNPRTCASYSPAGSCWYQSCDLSYKRNPGRRHRRAPRISNCALLGRNAVRACGMPALLFFPLPSHCA